MNEKRCADRNCEDTSEYGRWTVVVRGGRTNLIPCPVCNAQMKKRIDADIERQMAGAA